MKPHFALLVFWFLVLATSSCTHSPAGRSSAYSLALDGNFAAARQSVARGDGDETDIKQGAHGFMSRTLVTPSGDKWRDDSTWSSLDVESIEFWQSRGYL